VSKDASDFFRDAFVHAPHGILVVDGDRKVLAANGAAQDMLGDAVGATCCELLGCRSRSPLAEACVSELVRERGGALPEMRLDLDGDSPRSVWLTAAALPSGAAKALFHLRPGDPGDRRRRTDPHWMSGPELRIRALGRTQVASPEGPLGGDWLQHRPGQLLKYLVAEREREVHADEIGESLWPGAGPNVIGNVRHFVHALRERLEPGRPARAPSSFVTSARGAYGLDRTRVWIDADEFELEVAAGREALRKGDLAAAREALERALELYRGDFLADELYSPWAFPERERLREVAREALWALADVRVEQDDAEGARELYQRLAEMYPLDVDAQRALLAHLLRHGRRTDAVRRYSEFRARVAEEFGSDVEFSLADLVPRG
jgi:DNA-binding SARP family transcriptional activator